MHKTIEKVTEDIIERSRSTRNDYLQQMAIAKDKAPARTRLSCSNLAHGFAASEDKDKSMLRKGHAPNIGIVTSYNDMLSAHQPLGTYPTQIKIAANEVGATAQVAGGVPAMCDGVTQGQPGMELSLFSRDVIALATGISLSHAMFDGVLCLGVCDKIVPGLLIGALRFGHLPMIFVPAGPMPSGLPNAKKRAVRQAYVEGKADREQLLEAEAQSYHTAGTCNFYGTANSNQMLMETMGLMLPGAAFVNPNTHLRSALTRAATHRVAAMTALGEHYLPLGEIVDEQAIVNGMVGLLATGGSTNHTMHLITIARAAGIQINWDDFARISAVVPLLTRIYPNGELDVNYFHAAGGMGFLIRELLHNGFLHEKVTTVMGNDLSEYMKEPYLEDNNLDWRPVRTESSDTSVLRPVDDSFDDEGGVRILSGNLGQAVIKVSSVETEHRLVEAPCRIFHEQSDFEAAFKKGQLNMDCVIVMRYQGPRANGMPELHHLTPILSVLQSRGYKTALVTDGRMSGASGQVAAAIHVSPEAQANGPIAYLRDGDVILIDAIQGILSANLDKDILMARDYPDMDLSERQSGFGRELFSMFRERVGSPEEGATIFNWENHHY